MAVAMKSTICINNAMCLAGRARYSFSALNENTMGVKRFTTSIPAWNARIKMPHPTSVFPDLPLFSVKATTAIVHKRTETAIDRKNTQVSI